MPANINLNREKIASIGNHWIN